MVKWNISKDTIVAALEKLYLGLVFASIFVMKGFTAFNNDSQYYLSNFLARWNSDLYTNDYVAQAAVNSITPQYLSDVLLLVLSKLFGSLEAAMIAAYILCVLTASFAIADLLMRRLPKYRLLTGVFFVTCLLLLYTGEGIGNNWVWRESFFHQVPAFAAGMLGFCLALRQHHRNWILIFVFNGLAVLFQMQVGCFFFVFLFILFLVDIIRQKRPKILWNCIPFFVITGGIYLANYVTTGASIDNSDFMNIYAYFRMRQFLMLSELNTPNNLFYFLAYAMGILNLGIGLYYWERKEEDQLRIVQLIALSGLFVAVSLLFLLFNYIFVEHIPWGFAAILQSARIISVLRLWLFIVFAYFISRLALYQKYTYIVYIICGIFFISKDFFGGWLLLASYGLLLEVFSSKKMPDHCKIISLFTQLCLITMGVVYISLRLPFLSSTKVQCVLYISFLVVISFALELKRLNTQQRKIIAAFACIPLAILLMNRYAKRSSNGDWIGMSSLYEAFPYRIINSDLYDMAIELKNNTPLDTTYFADPYGNETTYVRLYAQRSEVVSSKSVPHEQEVMLEWMKRLEEFGAISLEGGTVKRFTNSFYDNDPQFIMDYALDYGARYIVTTTDDVGRFIETGNAAVWKSNDTYAIVEISG